MGFVPKMGSLTGKLAVKTAARTVKAAKPVKLAAPTRSGLGEKVKKPLADVLEAGAKKVVASKDVAAKEPAEKKASANKPAAKKIGNKWDSVKLPASSTGWWKVITKSMTNGGSWNYSWKFSDRNLAKKAAFELRAIGDLQSLEEGSAPASTYLPVANLRNVVSLIGKS